MTNEMNTDIAAMQQTLNRMREQLQQAQGQQQSIVHEIYQAFRRHGIASPNPNYAGNKNLQGLLLQLDNFFAAGGGDMSTYEEKGPALATADPEAHQQAIVDHEAGPSQAEINAAIMQQLAEIRATINGGNDDAQG